MSIPPRPKQGNFGDLFSILAEVTDGVVFEPLIPPKGKGRPTAAERAKAFDEANPSVYTTFVALALVLKKRGVKRYGAKAIFELIRWGYALTAADPSGEPYKLNNIYTAYYARKAMAENEALVGFFETRGSDGDE